MSRAENVCVRTCRGCGNGVEDRFRYCPWCAVPQRRKLVEFFAPHPGMPGDVQKARRYYGLLETQFRTYYEKANKQGGITGETLLRMLETRLDNVVYRLGFAGSRAQSRQLVRHGHFVVNGRRVNIPSFGVRPDDVISLKSGSPAETIVRDATDLTAVVTPWLQADHDGLTGKVLKWPERAEIDTPVQESLIVELYSK